MTEATQKLWAASDGNGGYDIGEGSYTLASVRNIKFQDGYRVNVAYEKESGRVHEPRALALQFKAAPDMLAALEYLRNEYCEGGMFDGTEAEQIILAAIAKARGEG